MIRRRSALVIEDHIPISLRVRPHPVHKPDLTSIVQVLLQGLSICGAADLMF